MSDAAAQPVVRLKIPCADGREFLERFAPRYAHGGVFVPGGRRPVGTRIHLKLEFRDGTVGVSGDALVTGQGTPEKPGMMLRFTALHPGSLQFELSPVGRSGPALTPARGTSAALAAPALTPARGMSPVSAAPALTPARAMTPVPAAPPAAAGPGRGELVDELFGPEMMEEESTGSDRPLEIRTSEVKLKLKETPREPPAAAPAPAETAPSAAAAEPEPAPLSGEPSPAGPPSGAEPPRGRGMRFGVAVAVLGLGVVLAVGLAVAGALASRQARERSERLEAELKVVDARILE
ncbi:MAG TPA: hypothetical protein VEP68_02360, partial [Anaeromyxobacteraceae bacterium]|nr:hypothetical protein [Anaeromyxobacteraceae bacterium]